MVTYINYLVRVSGVDKSLKSLKSRKGRTELLK